MKVVKNKMAPPFKEHEFDLLYGEGISRSGDLLDLATDLGIIDKAGAWFSYKNERMGQGREQSKAFLQQNPAIMSELEERIRLHFGLVPQVAKVLPLDAETAAKTDKDSDSDGDNGVSKKKKREAHAQA